MQDFLHHKGRQADGINRHGLRHGKAVGTGRCAAFIQDRDQRKGNNHHRHSGWDGQGQRHFPGPRQGGFGAGVIFGFQAAGQVGQKNDADGDANHPQWKLVQTVSGKQPANGLVELRGRLLTDQKVDLHDTTGQCCGNRNSDKVLHRGRPARTPGP